MHSKTDSVPAALALPTRSSAAGPPTIMAASKCRQRICHFRHCHFPHGQHPPLYCLQVRRSTYHDVVKLAELSRHVDVGGIQTYVINAGTDWPSSPARTALHSLRTA